MRSPNCSWVPRECSVASSVDGTMAAGEAHLGGCGPESGGAGLGLRATEIGADSRAASGAVVISGGARGADIRCHNRTPIAAVSRRMDPLRTIPGRRHPQRTDGSACNAPDCPLGRAKQRNAGHDLPGTGRGSSGARFVAGSRPKCPGCKSENVWVD